MEIFRGVSRWFAFFLLSTATGALLASSVAAQQPAVSVFVKEDVSYLPKQRSTTVFEEARFSQRDNVMRYVTITLVNNTTEPQKLSADTTLYITDGTGALKRMEMIGVPFTEIVKVRDKKGDTFNVKRTFVRRMDGGVLRRTETKGSAGFASKEIVNLGPRETRTVQCVGWHEGNAGGLGGIKTAHATQPAALKPEQYYGYCVAVYQEVNLLFHQDKNPQNKQGFCSAVKTK